MAQLVQFVALVNIRILYNGHKMAHAIKFQSVTFPFGIIAHMYGPVGNILKMFFMLGSSERYSAFQFLSACFLKSSFGF